MAWGTTIVDSFATSSLVSGLYVDSAYVYAIVQTTFDDIEVYTHDGTLVRSVDLSGISAFITDFTMKKDGTFIVLDSATKNIVWVSNDGTAIRTLAFNPESVNIVSIIELGNGDLLVKTNNIIYHIDTIGTVIKTYPAEIAFQGMNTDGVNIFSGDNFPNGNMYQISLSNPTVTIKTRSYTIGAGTNDASVPFPQSHFMWIGSDDSSVYKTY